MGKTKRGKGTKLMVLADGSGLPISVHVASASPHEVTLVERTLESRFVEEKPKRLIGDRSSLRLRPARRGVREPRHRDDRTAPKEAQEAEDPRRA